MSACDLGLHGCLPVEWDLQTTEQGWGDNHTTPQHSSQASPSAPCHVATPTLSQGDPQRHVLALPQFQKNNVISLTSVSTSTVERRVSLPYLFPHRGWVRQSKRKDDNSWGSPRATENVRDCYQILPQGFRAWPFPCFCPPSLLCFIPVAWPSVPELPFSATSLPAPIPLPLEVLLEEAGEAPASLSPGTRISFVSGTTAQFLSL